MTMSRAPGRGRRRESPVGVLAGCVGSVPRLAGRGHEDGEADQSLIADVQRDPYGAGLGKPEFLKGPLAGWASRRIDDEHRLVYRMHDGALEIAACYGH